MASNVLSYEDAQRLFPNYHMRPSGQPQVFSIDGEEEIYGLGIYGSGQNNNTLIITVAGFFWHPPTQQGGEPQLVGGPLYLLNLIDQGDHDDEGKRGLTVAGFYDVRKDEAVALAPSRVTSLFTSNRTAVLGMNAALGEIIQYCGFSRAQNERPYLIDCLRAVVPSNAAHAETMQTEVDRAIRTANIYIDLLFPELAVARLSSDIAALKDTPGATGTALQHPRREDLKFGDVAPGGGARVFSLDAFRLNKK